MKQQITLDQLKKCSRQRTLQLWMDKHDYGPLLTIGQMIEFLVEDYEKTGNRSLNMEQTNDGWSLWEFGTDAKELCDALWGAVKEVLEKQVIPDKKKF